MATDEINQQIVTMDPAQSDNSAETNEETNEDFPDIEAELGAQGYIDPSDVSLDNDEFYIPDELIPYQYDPYREQPIEKFTLFRKLPPEIRIDIWRSTWPAPRRFNLLLEDLGSQTRCKSDSLPVVLKVHRKSREEFFKKFQLIGVPRRSRCSCSWATPLPVEGGVGVEAGPRCLRLEGNDEKRKRLVYLNVSQDSICVPLIRLCRKNYAKLCSPTDQWTRMGFDFEKDSKYPPYEVVDVPAESILRLAEILETQIDHFERGDYQLGSFLKRFEEANGGILQELTNLKEIRIAPDHGISSTDFGKADAEKLVEYLRGWYARNFPNQKIKIIARDPFGVNLRYSCGLGEFLCGG